MKLELPCKLWQGACSGNGYGVTWSDGKTVSAHRHEYEKHHGPIPPGLVVRHRCDVRACYEITHLELGTNADNSRDMVERGRARGGRPRQYGSAFRLAVANLISSGWSNGRIAKQMGCCGAFVSYIRSGRKGSRHG